MLRDSTLCQSEEGNLSFSGKSNILAKLPVNDTMPVSDPGLPRLGSLSGEGKPSSDATEENGVKVCNTPGQRQRSKELHTCLFPVRW